jgi:purine-binding chemotaxis protein CheW
MKHRSYLLFTLDDTHYGLPAEAVQEIFLLPALTSVPESGPEVAGILNLRGKLLTVINLKACLGYPPQPNQLNQAVILMRCSGLQMGFVVDAIQNVEAIALGHLSNALETPYLSNVEHPLTAGLAQHDDHVVIVLDLEALLQSDQTRATLNAPAGGDRFMGQFSLADQQVLQDRATRLTQQLDVESPSDLTAVAVVGLDGEYFALELEAVYEFVEVPQVTPIPCCPPHIVGNMNLRGEILTLIDVRQFLNLSVDSACEAKKAVIMRLETLVAGVIIDDVFDVIYLQISDISAVPLTVHSHNNLYLKGVLRYGDFMMSFLDLPKLLRQGDLVVDQQILKR